MWEYRNFVESDLAILNFNDFKGRQYEQDIAR
jgi:hypothetical protein